MQIVLTTAQWVYLKLLVTHGSLVERAISKPVKISNDTIEIEIEDSTVTIELPD